MHLREAKQRRADGSVVSYLQRAEIVWDPTKRRSRARIVYNRGRANDPEVTERQRRLAKSIRGRCSPEEILAAGPVCRLVCAWSYGAVYVLEQIWQRLGIDAIVGEQACGKRLGFDVERALFALVANRACAPASRLYCHERWLKEEVRIAGTEGLELHQLYRAMDFLEADKEAIEQAIFFQVADLLSLDVEAIFYDTTWLHFEIDEEHGGDAAGRVRGSETAGQGPAARPRSTRPSPFTPGGPAATGKASGNSSLARAGSVVISQSPGLAARATRRSTRPRSIAMSPEFRRW
ncbi:MAG: hypothetical protein PVG98_11545 [Chromatiales bacterium]|jgi:hypothetical protein